MSWVSYHDKLFIEKQWNCRDLIKNAMIAGGKGVGNGGRKGKGLVKEYIRMTHRHGQQRGD